MTAKGAFPVIGMKEMFYFSAEGHEKGVSGVVMPYGELAAQRGYRLRVDRGAFAGLMDDVVVNMQHDPSLLLGRTGKSGNVVLTDSPEALLLSMTYPDTQLGRDAKALVDLGVLRGFSAEMHIGKDEWHGGVRAVKQAKLSGVGLVAVPAMGTAVLLSATDMEEGVKESGVFSVSDEFVRLGKRDFSGELLWDEVTVSSMAQRQAVKFLPDSLDIDMPVTLMLGADYNTSAANTVADGSLKLRKTNRGVTFEVKNLPRTENGEKLLAMLASGLITGWRVGYVPKDIRKTEDVEIMGFKMTLTEVHSAQMCEVRAASDGTGGNGKIIAGLLSSRRRRRLQRAARNG